MMKLDDSFNAEDESNGTKSKKEIDPFSFEIGCINYDTPISNFLKIHKKDLSSYIYHREVILNSDKKEQTFIFVLFEDILLTTDFEKEDVTSPLIMKIEYKRIYSVDIEVKDGKKNLVLKLMRSDNFTSFTNVLITFYTIRDLTLILHLIEKQRVGSWQKFYETSIPINPPFFYQKHFFLQKVNTRGKQQSRVIVFTNKFILNVSFDAQFKQETTHFTIESQKWALAIESIKSLTVLKKKSLTLKMYLDKSLNQKIIEANKLKLKNKNEREFLFYYEQDMKDFIYHCRRLYTNLKNTYLTVNLS